MKTFTEDFFREKGKKGGKKRWEGKTREEIIAHMTKMSHSRKKLSTGEVLPELSPQDNI